MNNPNLYNIRIINNYINYIKNYYPDVDINALLEYAGITSHELHDMGYWYSQKQSDLFHEIIVKKTGNENISREAFQFISRTGSYSLIRQYILGFISVETAYSAIEHITSKLTYGGTMKMRKLGYNKMEVNAYPAKNVIEKPYQCEARVGMLEAIPTMFNIKFADIEHPLCLHKGDKYCKYIISWDKPSSFKLKLIRNYFALFAVLISSISSIFLPSLYFIIIFLFSSSAALVLSCLYEYKKNKELVRGSESQGNTAEQLLEEINNRYNNSLLVQEIGEAISSILNLENLFKCVMQILDRRTDFDRGIILLANDDATRLIYKIGYGYNPVKELILKNTEFHLDNPESKGIFIKTFKEQKPFLVNDIDEIIDDMSSRSREFSDLIGTKSFITVPIVFKDKSLGVLVVDNVSSKRALTMSDMNLLSGIAQQIGISINNARSFIQLQKSEEQTRHLNELLLTILNIDHLITHEKNRDLLMKAICDKLIQTHGHSAAWIVLFNENGKFSNVFESGINGDYQIFLNKFTDELMLSCCKKALLQSDTVIINRMDSECGNCEFKGKYCREGRMLSRLECNGKIYGIMSVALEPGFILNSKEPRLLKEVADEIAFALYKIELEQERNDLQGQLFQSAKMSAVGQLAAGVAHEFNNILNVILGYTQISQLENSMTEIQDSLDHVEKAAHRGSSLVKKLSEFAKPRDPDFAIQDIVEVIQETIKFQRNQIQLGNIDVTLEAGVYSDVLFDRDQMGQVFLNLLINAIHAIKPKGKGNINILVMDVDGHLEIRFSDSGMGISKETIDKIFDPFFTTKGAYAKDNFGISGSGLGLSVTHSIIKQNNGTISVESEEGKGTTFIIKLPIPEGNHVKNQNEISEKINIINEKSKDLKIMIIDDEEELINLMKLMFKLNGFRNFLTEKNSDHAVKIFSEFSPDVVFLDILMPVMDGLQVFEKIKSINNSVPVVFMTGNLDGKENDYREMGVHDYLKKPFAIDKMFQIINQIAEEKEQTAADK